MDSASLGGARFYGPAIVVAIGNRPQSGRYGLAQLRTTLHGTQKCSHIPTFYTGAGMNITTLTSRELNQDVARAKRAAKAGPRSSSRPGADRHMCCSASTTTGSWLESAAILRTPCPWRDSARSIWIRRACVSRSRRRILADVPARHERRLGIAQGRRRHGQCICDQVDFRAGSIHLVHFRADSHGAGDRHSSN